MFLKCLGIVLVIFGCAGTGFSMAAAHRRECRALKQLISVLDYMGCELQYRLTPLPELCRHASKQAEGAMGKLLRELAKELESQVSADASCCMRSALGAAGNLPPVSKKMLELLGRTLGIFDLEGQLKGLENVRQSCRRELDALSENQTVRLRSYQTLGVCAGAALVILLF